MPLRKRKPCTRAFTAAAFAVALSIPAERGDAQSAAESASSPFEGLAGQWSGSGTIQMINGPNERLRCRASYVVRNGGKNLQQNLRCASDSYKFDVTSNVDYAAGAITGTWTEATNNATGFVTGTVSGGQVRTRVEGTNFGALMTVTTSRDRQSVTIQPHGMGVKEVSIRLGR